MVRNWSDMINEKGVRERIASESPDALRILDYLQSKVRPYKEIGWTSFNDWLDKCYFSKKRFMDNRPENIKYVSLDDMRDIVFPACR